MFLHVASSKVSVNQTHSCTGHVGCIDVSNESFCLEHKVQETVILFNWNIKGPSICMMEEKSAKYLAFGVFDVKYECNAIKKA